MKNFHLPFVASEAIESWLRHCQKVSRHKAISEFARDFAATPYDLDVQLEAAATEHLLGKNREKA